MARLAILGAGMMGETILGGLVDAGWDPASITVVERSPERCAELAERHGVTAGSAVEAAGDAETVLVAVKPQDVETVLSAVASVLRPGTLVASLCAGVSTARIESLLPPRTPVVRVMPNTPARVGAGMSALSAGSAAEPRHVREVSEICAAVGEVVTVPEHQQDAVTAISGSGPAYVFLVAEAMIEAGVHLGLPRATASRLATQTMLGSARLLAESGQHPALLREQVTSPAGTTAAALRTLEDHGVRAAFLSALESARDRSIELGDG